MLEHLLDLSEIPFKPDIDADTKRPFVPAEKLDAAQMLDAKLHTANMFADLGVVDDDTIAQERSKTESTVAFSAMLAGDEKAQMRAITALTLPESVRGAVAMLTQYQWDFVEQAGELRSMVVSKLVKETDHPTASIRLRALEMIGKITEVALFTDRVQVQKTDMDTGKLEEAIREKLMKFAQRVVPQEVEEAVLIENVEPQGEVSDTTSVEANG